jgi:predicted transcriptional regulator
MARIPLEDNFNDVINKTRRGLSISDRELAQRAEVSLAELGAVAARRNSRTRGPTTQQTRGARHVLK